MFSVAFPEYCITDIYSKKFNIEYGNLFIVISNFDITYYLLFIISCKLDVMCFIKIYGK
jgi:hypothetical protein